MRLEADTSFDRRLDNLNEFGGRRNAERKVERQIHSFGPGSVWLLQA